MTNKQQIKAIIFDLGGVIVDLDWNECVNNFKKIGVDNIDMLISTTLQRGFILEYELGKITSEEFRNEVRKYAVKDVTDEQINYAWKSLVVSIPPQKLELLKRLKSKYRVLMLSNTNEMSYQKCVDEMFNINGNNVNDYFDKCYLSYKMHLNKPNAEIFEALLHDSGLKAEECLFLDDGEHNINTAKSLGMQTILVEPSSELDLKEYE